MPGPELAGAGQILEGMVFFDRLEMGKKRITRRSEKNDEQAKNGEQPEQRIKRQRFSVHVFR